MSIDHVTETSECDGSVERDSTVQQSMEHRIPNGAYVQNNNPVVQGARALEDGSENRSDETDLNGRKRKMQKRFSTELDILLMEQVLSQKDLTATQGKFYLHLRLWLML